MGFDDPVLAKLCSANGISKDAYTKKGDVIEKIEMFLVRDYPRIKGLHYFSNLRVLSIIQQEITMIEGLESLVHVEKLWLCENKIKKIQGLTNLTNLRELYL